VSATLTANLRSTAARAPDQVALVQGERAVTWAALWEMARRFAGGLRCSGFAAGDRVALALENSAEYVAAYYGTLLAGGIVVPLNVAAKSRDFEFWLRHCGASWLVGSAENRELLAAASTAGPALRVVTTAGTAPGSTAFAGLAGDIDADVAVDAHAPACILYTSGTTGSPKGVLLSQHNLASNTDAIVQYLGLTAADSIVCVLPFYYSYGNSVLHTHVKVGARIVLDDNLVYPHKVVDNIARSRVTGFAGVPSTFSLLLGRVTLRDFDLSALRYLTQAGGPMSVATTQKLREALPHASLFVMYGQTEASARLTYLPPADLDRKLGSVGVALPGVELEVRSESGARCDSLQTGTVWVRGPNVMRGYWNNPEATAATLRDGWLNTGDIGHLDADGFLFLAGRRSDMIKTGAHRVHPKDVEEVIEELAEVAEVAVVGVSDEMLGQAIKAFVVPKAAGGLDVMRVKAHCRQRLANYKIPKYVDLVGSLPKTASGKIRRHELVERHSE
jgi:acyl-CoA synthetase (AMP-forming)/AMP-acid ligase II